jgi:hypothetical protein
VTIGYNPRLDAAIRALERRVMLQPGAGGDDAIPKLRGEQILQWLRQVGHPARPPARPPARLALVAARPAACARC